MLVRIRMTVTAMFGTSLAIVLMLLLIGCTMDTASQQGEPIGNTQQRWQTGYSQVGGTFEPRMGTVVETFADSTGVHMVGTSTGNRTWYQRVATDGVTVTVPWAQIPGQNIFFGTTSSPTIVRGKRMLRSRDPYIVFRTVSGSTVEYTTLNHYLIGDTWSWTGTWTTVPTIPAGMTAPITSTYLNGTGRIYVFFKDVASSLPHTTYSDDNGANWSGPYDIGGGTGSYFTAVDHHTDATNHYIELVKRTDDVPPLLQWNRLLDPAALDSTDWRGWQTIPGTVISYEQLSSTVEKTYNFCVYAVELNYRKVWQNCTTYGQGGDSSTFAANWTQLPSTFSSYNGSGSSSYCTSNDSVPDLCPNGSTKKYNFITHTTYHDQLWMQWELK